MREIKFRLWDSEDKIMYNADKGWYINMTGEIQQHPSIAPLQGIILMQYTGLKDKNGKEIYEGDIVYYNQGLSMGGTNSLGRYDQPRLMDGTRVVVWKDKGFDWAGNHSGLAFCKGGEGEFEIIGNIYENPELLEKELLND